MKIQNGSQEVMADIADYLRQVLKNIKDYVNQNKEKLDEGGLQKAQKVFYDLRDVIERVKYFAYDNSPKNESLSEADEFMDDSPSPSLMAYATYKTGITFTEKDFDSIEDYEEYLEYIDMGFDNFHDYDTEREKSHFIDDQTDYGYDNDYWNWD